MTEYQGPTTQPQKWTPHQKGVSNSIYIRVENEPEEHELKLTNPIKLGREFSETFSSIDLSPAGGMEKGVSRSHAMIMKHNNAIVIVDSGSLNGTYVNAQRVEPFMPTKIKNGDYIHLGQLLVQVRTPS